MRDAVGRSPDAWRVAEMGEGNLNLVSIVEGTPRSMIVRQALHCVRLLGESWPVPPKHAWFEYNALIRQDAVDPGIVPAVLYFDRDQALIVMERLSPHIILRGQTMARCRVAGLGQVMGRFCARTAFRCSDLAMNPATKKADVALRGKRGAVRHRRRPRVHEPLF